MGFLSFSIAYGARTSLYFAITKMVVIQNVSMASDECIANGNSSIGNDFDEVNTF